MSGFDAFKVSLKGTHSIEASAGTGKTHAVATLFVRLVIENGLGVERILVVTFTEAAAAELRDRIRTRLQQTLDAYDTPDVADPELAAMVRRRLAAGLRDRDRVRLLAGLHAFDEAAISTIHGFCHRVLHDRAFESGVAFDTELVVDDGPMLEEVVRDFWATHLHAADARLVRHLDERNVGPATWLDLARLASRHAFAPVRPARTEPGSAPEHETYARAYAHARAQWRKSRGEIVELLCGFKHFKVSYRQEQVPFWAMTVDAFLEDPEPGTSLVCANGDRFLRSVMRTHTLKHAQTRPGPPQHAFFDAWAELDEARSAWSDHLSARELDLRRRLVAHVRSELPRRKAEAGVQSFDDLLVRLRTALEGRGGRRLAGAIRERYEAALIDEFQDTDPTQYRIFDAIYRGTAAPCFLIGDPKQAIYGFRGADVFAYLQAAHACESRHTMVTNRRSDPELLSAIERLFAVPDPFLLRGIEFVSVGAREGAGPGLWRGGAPLPAFEALFCPRTPDNTKKLPGQILGEWVDRCLPDRVAADIARLLDEGVRVGGPSGRALGAGDVAVLVRKNDQALRMQRALRALGIPGVVYGDATVFETPEATELQRVLQAAAEPTRATRLRAAVTTELFGVGAGELQAMLAAEDDANWDDWIDRFRHWHATWVERGFVQMFRAIVEQPGLQSRVLGMADGERRMTNLLHLGELLHDTARREHLGPEGLLRWLGEQIRRPPRLADTYKLRLERDDEAVQLVTVHRSKGLEYPVVYCPYAWDGSLLFPSDEEYLVVHDADAGHELVLDVRLKGDRDQRNRDPAIAQARNEKRAENLRLLYVALTRARHRCVIVWGGFHRSEHSPLGYLLHATPNSGGPDAIADAIKPASDAALLARLQERGEAAWTVRPLEEPSAPPSRLPRLELAPIAGRKASRTIDRVHTVSSFSRLSASSEAGPSAHEGRDRDERADEPALAIGDTLAPSVALAAFPRGARAGNFFHDVLEHVDFQATHEVRVALVEDRLRAHGFAPDAWTAPVAAALHDILHTPIRDTPRFALTDIALADRKCELEFMLPVAHGSDTAIAMTREGLALAFADHARGLPSGYAARIESLAFGGLRGHLKGFIDLVFRHTGQWWVVDYKTNHLGDGIDDYAHPRMLAAMAEHHYVLQYHLYLLALVRHLRRHDSGFDYDRDVGGIAYLFLRGMSQRSGSSRGVFVDKPPRERIEALSRLLEGRR